MAYFSKTTEKITPENYFSKVKSITVRICITNCSGTIYVTDLCFSLVLLPRDG